MTKPRHKRNVNVTHVRPRKISEQERKVARALIALARVQLATEAEDLADEVAEAEATAEQVRRQTVRQRRAERAARRQEQDEISPMGDQA